MGSLWGKQTPDLHSPGVPIGCTHAAPSSLARLDIQAPRAKSHVKGSAVAQGPGGGGGGRDQIVVFGGRAQPPVDHFEIPYINGNVTNEVWSKRIDADPAQSSWVLRRADEGDPVVVTTRYISDSIPDYYLRTTPLKREKHACVAHGTSLYVWGGKSFWW